MPTGSLFSLTGRERSSRLFTSEDRVLPPMPSANDRTATTINRPPGWWDMNVEA
jgi:hypothetical protein